MELNHRVYGKIEIIDPVVLDIIGSGFFQRLKNISIAVYFEPFYPKTCHTRWEHSIGCYYLLRKFKAGIKEQIYGLLHDISHTAFSHCIS